MKIITITQSDRPQTRAILGGDIKVHSISDSIITFVAPHLTEAKDMFLTFTPRELRDMLKAFEDYHSEANNLAATLQGNSDNTKPDSLV